jgi:hypothetical protein
MVLTKMILLYVVNGDTLKQQLDEIVANKERIVISTNPIQTQPTLNKVVKLRKCITFFR